MHAIHINNILHIHIYGQYIYIHMPFTFIISLYQKYKLFYVSKVTRHLNKHEKTNKQTNEIK